MCFDVQFWIRTSKVRILAQDNAVCLTCILQHDRILGTKCYFVTHDRNIVSLTTKQK